MSAPSAEGRHDSKKDLPSILQSKTLLAEHTRMAGPAGADAGWRTRCLTNRVYSLFTISNIRAPLPGRETDANLYDTGLDDIGDWWSQTGSNRRPPECKSGALPAELWPLVEKDLTIMVGLGRLERPTSPLSGVRSNHLSYRP